MCVEGRRGTFLDYRSGNAHRGESCVLAPMRDGVVYGQPMPSAIRAARNSATARTAGRWSFVLTGLSFRSSDRTVPAPGLPVGYNSLRTVPIGNSEGSCGKAEVPDLHDAAGGLAPEGQRRQKVARAARASSESDAKLAARLVKNTAPDADLRTEVNGRWSVHRRAQKSADGTHRHIGVFTDATRTTRKEVDRLGRQRLEVAGRRLRGRMRRFRTARSHLSGEPVPETNPDSPGKDNLENLDSC